jgi:hypothetical protein
MAATLSYRPLSLITDVIPKGKIICWTRNYRVEEHFPVVIRLTIKFLVSDIVCSLKYLVALLIILAASNAFADWAIVGATYKCNGESLTLEGIVNSSSGSIKPKSGTTKLVKSKNIIRCPVGDSLVEARVFATPPSDHGECGSAGTVWLESIRINGRDYLTEPGYINNYCTMQPTFNKIVVKNKRKSIVLRTCRAIWDWGNEFENEKCDEINIANPAVNTGAMR